VDRNLLAGQALAQRAFTDRLRLRGGQLLVQRVGIFTGTLILANIGKLTS
jgi:hypothetical protein